VGRAHNTEVAKVERCDGALFVPLGESDDAGVGGVIER